jgi:hypothetical protein
VVNNTFIAVGAAFPPDAQAVINAAGAPAQQGPKTLAAF